MVKIKSWPKLILSIILAQSAGHIGTFFTLDAIPTWYATLTRPSFAPPNWLFGPVWTILYTLIGISLYLIWTSKKGNLKLFLFHLFLNAIWSPIFFGAKNLGLALIVIILMDITLVVIIKNFYKLNKIAAIVLIPYLIWISFATILNFSFWQLNPQRVSAQDFTFQKAREDFVFSEDNYRKDLSDYNLKRASYQKDPTLSLKEEFRLSSYTFVVVSRNRLVKNYLTMIRMKIVESQGLSNDQKNTLFGRIDSEVAWYTTRKDSYNPNDTIEDIFKKAGDEDLKFETETLPVIYTTLAYSSLGDAISIKNKHLLMYEKLKKEAESLVSLGRADSSLFERWYKDIEREKELISEIEKNTLTEIEKILGADTYQRKSGYENALETINPIKSNFLQLNKFIMELENVIQTKR